MIIRPRRLRANKNIRNLSRETRLSPEALIYPLFIREGKNIKNPISSMDGQFHFSCDRVAEAVDKSLARGVNKFLIFGVPESKDEHGSGAYAEDGVVQCALRTLRERYGQDIYLVTDVCMCEYTSHGHCGVLDGEHVDNDKTIKYLADIAVSHAEAGADMVAPSDMMDGRVAEIRGALDSRGFADTAVMSYAVKYASAFYAPFREAAGSAPSFGDRKTYQMDWHNKREALKEAALDIGEGADIIIVKPALCYLDIVCEVSKMSGLPVAAYSVSGEYAMLKAAASAGLVDEYAAMCESAVSVFRAGADILITYYAGEIAEAIAKGDIG